MRAWIFCTSAGTPMDESRVRKGLLVQQGESPAYAQRQLGHASIQLTVDIYGKWLPLGNKAAVDGLDERPSETRW